ncbi:MAG: radical SAM protein [Nanobdellota archaeon]
MVEFEFQDIKFVDKGDFVRAVFLVNFYFDLPKETLESVGNFTVTDGKLIFRTGRNIEKKVSRLISNGFDNLYCSVTGREAVYIHSNSGIPLIGSSYFGIVDRNTNLIELRPNTGCNLSCIYCSVNEGGYKAVDFVVEKDYIVNELGKLLEFKQENDIEIHINPQGEPLLYGSLEELIHDVSKFSCVKRISMDTNGLLLTKQKVDSLLKSGLTRFNISIDSLNLENAKRISQRNYPVNRLMEIISYISTKGQVMITPLLLNGINDNEIEDLIKFAMRIGINLGIQNFLSYKHGKNPVKPFPMNEFYDYLKNLEEKYDIKLIYSASDFGIHKTKVLPCPYKKNDIVECEIFSKGRAKDELLGVLDSRSLEIKDIKKEKKSMKVKIIRTKHNILKACQLT